MSEPTLPPPPPPSYTPPPPPTGPSGTGAVSPNRNIMIVLSYLGILAVVPLIAEKDDREVQWHAKHGLLLTGVWIALSIVLGIIGHMGPLACAMLLLWPILWLGILVIHILCIVKGINGQRFIIPGISQYVDRF